MYVRLISSLGAIAATAATIAFATPAFAQAETRTAIVSFAGLDPAKPADAARLDRRIRAAARQVCGPDEGRDLRARQQAMECRRDAVARANADVRLALRGGGGTQVTFTTP